MPCLVIVPCLINSVSETFVRGDSFVSLASRGIKGEVNGVAVRAEDVIPDIPKLQGKAVKLKGSLPIAIAGVDLLRILGRESDLDNLNQAHGEGEREGNT